VGLAEQNLVPYILLMIAVLLPAGMGLIGWLSVLQRGFEEFKHNPLIVTLTLIGFMASVFVPPFPIFGPEKIPETPSTAQWENCPASRSWNRLFSSDCWLLRFSPLTPN